MRLFYVLQAIILLAPRRTFHHGPKLPSSERPIKLSDGPSRRARSTRPNHRNASFTGSRMKYSDTQSRGNTHRFKLVQNANGSTQSSLKSSLYDYPFCTAATYDLSPIPTSVVDAYRVVVTDNVDEKSNCSRAGVDYLAGSWNLAFFLLSVCAIDNRSGMREVKEIRNGRC